MAEPPAVRDYQTTLPELRRREFPDRIPGNQLLPTSAPTLDLTPTVSYVDGSFAECSLDGTVIAALFDWKIKLVTRFMETSAHGDTFEIYVPTSVMWTAEAQGYLPGVTTYLAYYHTSGAPPVMTFRGYGAAASRPSALIFTGTCYIAEAEVSAAMRLMEQRIELQGSGLPSAGLPAAPGPFPTALPEPEPAEALPPGMLRRLNP